VRPWTCQEQNTSRTTTKLLAHQARRISRKSSRRSGMANIDIEGPIMEHDIFVGRQKVDRTGTRFSHVGVLEYSSTVAFWARAWRWDHARFAKRLQLLMDRYVPNVSLSYVTNSAFH
jgi:hypothetical protein